MKKLLTLVTILALLAALPGCSALAADSTAVDIVPGSSYVGAIVLTVAEG